MDFQETFRRNLIKLRELAGLSKAEVAEKAGLKYTTYNSYEVEGKIPKIDKIISLATALNCTVDELLGLSKDIIKENIQYARENGFEVQEEADGNFIIKLSSQLSSVIEFYSNGQINPSKRNKKLRLSLSDFSEWVTLAKISFENRADVKSVFKTLRHEELEQILSDIIRNRYNANDKGNS